MPNLMIRDIPEDIVTKLDAQARATGLTRQQWLRKQVIDLVTGLTRERAYRLRFYHSSRTGGRGNEAGYIERIPNSPELIRSSLVSTDEELIGAYTKACEYVRNDGPGDYERAVELLKPFFDPVIFDPL